MPLQKLKGRMIDDVPFTGLVERLCQISLTCHTAGESAEHLSKDDLLNVLAHIVEAATEAMAFSGATREEIQSVTEFLLEGMQAGRDRLQ